MLAQCGWLLFQLIERQDQKRAAALGKTATSAPVFCILMLGMSSMYWYNTQSTKNAAEIMETKWNWSYK
jgi:hypothetical protein